MLVVYDSSETSMSVSDTLWSRGCRRQECDGCDVRRFVPVGNLVMSLLSTKKEDISTIVGQMPHLDAQRTPIDHQFLERCAMDHALVVGHNVHRVPLTEALH